MGIIMSYNFKKAKKEEKTPISMGAAVLIIKDNCILLGKRKSDIGQGLYGLPGGHLDEGETIEECAVREIKEETNLDIDSIEEVGFDTDEENFLTLFYKVEIKEDDKLKNMEPDKSEDWEWYSLDALPSPLFGEIERMVKRL
jgi:8-oxo-dGTP diphosphatase